MGDGEGMCRCNLARTCKHLAFIAIKGQLLVGNPATTDLFVVSDHPCTIASSEEVVLPFSMRVGAHVRYIPQSSSRDWQAGFGIKIIDRDGSNGYKGYIDSGVAIALLIKAWRRKFWKSGYRLMKGMMIHLLWQVVRDVVKQFQAFDLNEGAKEAVALWFGETKESIEMVS